jgi:NhaA family Na+:H+ antiporter
MRHQASHHSVHAGAGVGGTGVRRAAHAGRRAAHAGAAVRRPADRWFRFVADRFLLLPLGAAVALVWANTGGESYFRFAHAIAFPVNAIGMAFFLGLIMQEVVEEVMPGGALHTWRRWSLPVVAAAGGALGSIFVYDLWVRSRYELVLVGAWPVAAAIDIAAGYYVLKAIKARHGAIPFLLVVAIVTSAAGLLVMAAWPPQTGTAIEGVALLAAAVGLAALLRRRGVRSFWPYIVICGTLSWFGFYVEGIHPALALVPIVPFLPHEPRAQNPFADPPDDDQVHHAEHEWHYGVQGVLFLFGLANAGVLVAGYDTGTWAVLAAALAGRPLGILAAVGIAVLLGLRLPSRIGWRELIVVALATSSGFTFALFAATSLLPVGAVLQQIKMGALASAAGAVAVVAAAWLLRVGRFAR